MIRWDFGILIAFAIAPEKQNKVRLPVQTFFNRLFLTGNRVPEGVLIDKLPWRGIVAGNRDMKNLNAKRVELVICVGAFALVSLLSERFQKPITFQNGLAWDGGHYCRIAEQFLQGKPIVGTARLGLRIGTPLLAALVSPHDLLHGFKAVNFGANMLLLVLFMAWLRLHLQDWRIRTLLVLLLVTQWFGPFRYLYWSPVNTDHALYCFLLLGLICIHFAATKPRLATAGLGMVILVGVVFRETVLLLAVALLFADNPIQFKGLWNNMVRLQWREIIRMPRLIYFIPLLVGVVSFGCVRLVVHEEGGDPFLKYAAMMFYYKPWPTYLHAALVAFGPVLALPLYNARRSWSFLQANQPLLAFLAGLSVLAYIGGTDTERFWYWTMPVTYLLIGKAIADNWQLLGSKPLLLVLGASQLVSQRVFWTLPDYPNEYHTPFPILTIVGSRFQYFDILCTLGSKTITGVSLAEYVLLVMILLVWLAYRAKSQTETPRRSDHRLPLSS
jgi:hypothetical protein